MSVFAFASKLHRFIMYSSYSQAGLGVAIIVGGLTLMKQNAYTKNIGQTRAFINVGGFINVRCFGTLPLLGSKLLTEVS